FERLETCTGVDELVVVPLPSWPLAFPPQDQTVPSTRSARLCELPAAIAVTRVRLETATGVVAFVVVPLPSWPELFRPQAQTVPSLLTARLWLAPAAIRPCVEAAPVPVWTLVSRLAWS